MIKKCFKIIFYTCIIVFGFWLYKNLDFETAFLKFPDSLNFEFSQKNLEKSIQLIYKHFSNNC